MAYDIGPRVLIKGEQEFNQQIKGINDSLKVVGSSMKALTSEFEENGESQEALTKKNKVLNQQLDLQKQKLSLVENQLQKENKKLDELAKALQDASNEYGEHSTQAQKAANAYRKQEETVNKLKVGINETNSFINKLSNSINKNENSLREMENGSRDAVTGLKKLEDKTEDVTSDMKKASSAADNLKSAFAGAFTGSAVIEGIQSLGDGLKDLNEESKEYLKVMGALEVSSEAAGYSAGETAETYQKLYAVLADEQSAATTTANLQALGLSQKDLNDLVDYSIGAWTRYGDSIPIDGLSEAINETVKVGKVTGVFADVLNWAGTSEDEFNERLEKAGSKAERMNIVLSELSRQGLDQSAKKFRENNDALVKSNEAQARWQSNLAELSKMVMPVFTDLLNLLSKAIEFFLELPQPVQDFVSSLGALIVVLTALAPVIIAVTAASSALEIGLMPFVGIIAGIVAAIAGLIAIFMNWDEIIQWFGNQWNSFTTWCSNSFDDFMKTIKGSPFESILKGMIDFVGGIFTNDWQRVWKGVQNIFGGIMNGLVGLFKSPFNWIIDNINSFIKSVNKIKIPKWVPVVGGKGFNIPRIPRLKVGMEFVPSDFFPAYLDYGEAVLTKEQNAKLRKMGGIAAIENETLFASSTRKVNRNNTFIFQSILDGKIVAESTTEVVTNNQTGRMKVRGV